MEDKLMGIKAAFAAVCSAAASFLGWQGVMTLVWVAAISDGVMAVMCSHLPLQMDWPTLVLPLVLGWYILTELGSILENAVKLGAHVPGWLVKLLQAGKEAMEQ